MGVSQRRRAQKSKKLQNELSFPTIKHGRVVHE